MSTWHEKLANRKQNQLDEERKKKVEVNDISFPSLGNSGSAWGGGGGAWKQEPETKPKLASLVAKWDEDAKMKAEIEAARKEAPEPEHHVGFLHSRYYFGNTHSRDEDTYYEEEEDMPPPPSADTSSDWRTIEKPVRKPKKSAADRMLSDIQEAPVEESFVWREEEASVWGAERS
jgi:hypothetical protein